MPVLAVPDIFHGMSASAFCTLHAFTVWDPIVCQLLLHEEKDSELANSTAFTSSVADLLDTVPITPSWCYSRVMFHGARCPFLTGDSRTVDLIVFDDVEGGPVPGSVLKTCGGLWVNLWTQATDLVEDYTITFADDGNMAVSFDECLHPGRFLLRVYMDERVLLCHAGRVEPTLTADEEVV